eukprot:TRINITY_DN13536_c0_g1_i1.p1 TRINITY_DN13536_c0_g1~~TRINITY_DN13536_c0_g1_i1.p1  ORF type:complete len:259 (-),score=29.66 TRINITY_DN13536_c0_g1_i1:767-1504(-)
MVVKIMGEFATLMHYNEVADFLSTQGYEVLTFDNRGIGKSTTQIITQTSKLLGQDTVELVDHVWGKGSTVHVYGASMGGCIAQYAAVSLAKQKRLKSLYLAVTPRGSFIRLPFCTWFYKMVMPLVVKNDPREMVAWLIPKSFSADYLEATHTNGRKMYDLWFERWTAEYKEWFSFYKPEICASQSTVFSLHYLEDSDLALLRDVGVPISVHIAVKDDLMKPSQQFQLADDLKCNRIVFSGGQWAI